MSSVMMYCFNYPFLLTYQMLFLPLIVTLSFNTIFAERLCYKLSKKYNFLSYFWCVRDTTKVSSFHWAVAFVNVSSVFVTIYFIFQQCIFVLEVKVVILSKLEAGDIWVLRLSLKKPCLICGIIRHCLKWQLSFGYLLQLIKVLWNQIFYFFSSYII